MSARGGSPTPHEAILWRPQGICHLTRNRFIDIETTDHNRTLHRALLSALFVCLISTPGASQFPVEGVQFFENGQPTRTGPDAAMFPDTPTRLKLDLSGMWNYTVDGKAWRSAAVPSAYDYSGQVIFQRTFEIKPDTLDKYTFDLVVYGINYQSEITINGNFVGRHTGGYSSFVLPIPPNTLQVGTENAIRITIDNELTPRTTLPLRQQVGGWRSYGGIFRDIYLLAVPKLFVEAPEIKTEILNGGKAGKLSIRADLTDRASGIKPETGSTLGFQVEVNDKLQGTPVGKSAVVPFTPVANKSVTVNADVQIPSPKLWSPESPDLYVVKCEIVRVANKVATPIDEYDTDTGFREIEWRDGRLYMNGTPELVHGVLWQENHATYGSALTYEALERDVASIKAVGANCIRFLYPPHPYMLNLCDRYGILVMEEIPVDDVPEEILLKDYYQDLATSYAKEMVERDRRHVCVLAWGLGNEFQTSTMGACDYVNGLRNVVKALDRRNVYFGTHLVDDSCFEYVDMVAVDYYGTDVREFREALKRCKSAHPDKPIIVARYGREVEPGNHNGYSDPLSMESQARTVMLMYEAIKEAKVAGSILWSFNDWRTDRPALTAHSADPYLCAMGIVSAEREKRTAFDVVRAVFNGEKVQALPIGNYSSNAPIIFVVSGFLALVTFAFIYNSNRRFRDCVNRSLFRTYNFFADVRDQRILTYGNSIFLAAIIALTWATVLASVFSHYRDNLLLDNLLSQFLGDNLKDWFIRLVWSPPKFILVFTGIIFFKLVVISLLVKLLSMTVRTHVYFYHAFSITMWSMLPYIILIPVAMILFRLMDAQFYITPVFVLTALLTVWALFRLLKGISIIYDVFPIKVYAVGVLMMVIVCAALYGYLDYTKSTTVYLKYMMQSMSNSA